MGGEVCACGAGPDEACAYTSTPAECPRLPLINTRHIELRCAIWQQVYSMEYHRQAVAWAERQKTRQPPPTQEYTAHGWADEGGVTAAAPPLNYLPDELAAWLGVLAAGAADAAVNNIPRKKR